MRPPGGSLGGGDAGHGRVPWGALLSNLGTGPFRRCQWGGRWEEKSAIPSADPCHGRESGRVGGGGSNFRKFLLGPFGTDMPNSVRSIPILILHFLLPPPPPSWYSLENVRFLPITQGEAQGGAPYSHSPSALFPAI